MEKFGGINMINRINLMNRYDTENYQTHFFLNDLFKLNDTNSFFTLLLLQLRMFVFIGS